MQVHVTDLHEPEFDLTVSSSKPWSKLQFVTSDQGRRFVFTEDKVSLIQEISLPLIEPESPRVSPRSSSSCQPSSPSSLSSMSGYGPLATGDSPTLPQVPYPALSSLQREIMLQIQNNDAPSRWTLSLHTGCCDTPALPCASQGCTHPPLHDMSPPLCVLARGAGGSSRPSFSPLMLVPRLRA
jgi:hypothetical protein